VIIGARIGDVASSVLSAVAALPPLLLSLDDASGCTLAEDIVAATPLPAYDLAVYDGYAVRAADVAQATLESPALLTVVDTVTATTSLPSSVRDGVCVRVETGARMPLGAELVVPTEHTDAGAETAAIYGAPALGDGVRPVGCEVAQGEVVLSEGDSLGIVELAVLSALGRREVMCFPRPRVVIVTTGEYGPSGTSIDGLSHALAAGVTAAGGIAYRVAAPQPAASEMHTTLEDHLIRADLMIVCGGAALGKHGPYGVLPQALEELGTVTFTPVAARPLGFVGFGTIGVESVPFFALPPDPASALVAFETLVRPAITVLAARSGSALKVQPARLDKNVVSETGVCDLIPVSIAKPDLLSPIATPLIAAGGHPPLSLLAKADGFAIIHEESPLAVAGSKVDVMLFGTA
jgi:molybdopterin molybdotransferase